ncbi:glycosyltransferase family 4 protein [Candidatus Woesearchaeota archaeon]|nr:glycosyltransferase family 4 protein [Candidatus Woesearchaeota archaeon]
MPKVLHIITKLAVGGAQETVITIADALQHTPGFSVIIASGPTTQVSGSLEDVVKKKRIPHTLILGLQNEISPFQNLAALYRLYRFIKNEKPDIVSTHSSVAGILGRIAAKLAGVSVIIHTVHGWGLRDDMSWLKKKLYIFLERWCGRLSDKVIVVSRYNLTKGIHEGIVVDPKKYMVIHSGIDVAAFENRRRKKIVGISSHQHIVGTVGRLTLQKNPLDFIKTAEIVYKTIPNCCFVFVGDGELRTTMEAEIIKRNLQKRVLLLGFRSDVSELMQHFDMFLLTSLWEGLPQVIPQAMAASKPVVSTDVDGNKEAVTDGITGFLVPPNRPDLLAEKVIYLLKHPKIAKKMGAAGKKRVQQFSRSRMLHQTLDLYQELLTSKKPL